MTGSLPTRSWRPFLFRTGLLLSVGPAAAVALGQAYFDTRNPFTAPVPPEPVDPAEARAGSDFTANERVPYRPGAFSEDNYNLKLGPVLASFGASLTSTYNSNALQSNNGGKNYDIIVVPGFNTNLRWQATESARLSLDIGVGYQFHLVQDELNGLQLGPTSVINYAFSIEDVLITVYNRVSTANDASQRSDIIGTGNPVAVRFNRINNSTGLSAEWAPYEDLSVSGDYTFSLERGMGDSYALLDGQSHTLSAATFYRLNPVLTVGISGSGSINDYANNFQNSSKTYGIGPTVSWRVTDFLSLSASVRYTTVHSDRGGQTGDTSDFAGISGNISVSHQINEVLNHGISFGRSVNGALGSNFGTSLNAAYQLSWQLTDRVPLNFTASYDKSEQSGGLQLFQVPLGTTSIPSPAPQDGSPFTVVLPDGTQIPGVVFAPGGFLAVSTPGQVSDTYRFGVSTSYQLASQLSMGLGYSYDIRNTDFVLGDYNSHTVTLSLNYSF